MKITAVLLLVAIATVSAEDWQKPWFCHRLDCPPYNVTFANETAGIEFRDYEEGVWVSTNWTGVRIDVADNIGFNRLFNYISGKNEAGIAIDMTSPVRTEVIPGQGPFCNSTFIISFYAPYPYQNPNNPLPAPTDPDVYVTRLPKKSRAVYGFGGYHTTWDSLLPEIEYLYQYLIDQRVKFFPVVQTIAGYDPPFRPINRHTEVWATLL